MFPVGIDVSKNTLDLCILYDGIKGRIKTRNIQNNRHSVENILRWLRIQHCGPEDVHVVMEATGVYHDGWPRSYMMPVSGFLWPTLTAVGSLHVAWE